MHGPPVRCAYLKLINVPSILDIGGTTPDPTDESLTMSMIDYTTLEEISRFTKDEEALSIELSEGENNESGISKSENDDTPLV